MINLLQPASAADHQNVLVVDGKLAVEGEKLELVVVLMGILGVDEFGVAAGAVLGVLTGFKGS